MFWTTINDHYNDLPLNGHFQLKVGVMKNFVDTKPQFCAINGKDLV